MKYIVFYSWLSDLPNNTNRSFIESVMNAAIKDIKGDDRYELEPSIDRDTQGQPGAPNISQTLMDKIRTSDAFVADISIVTGVTGCKGEGQRPSPNPNVLLELGYAIATLGWDRIILFYNENYGTDEDIPFDIRQHRRIGYSLSPNDNEKATMKKKLAGHFKSRLIELIEAGKKPDSSIKKPSLFVQWCLSNGEEKLKVLQLKRASTLPDISDEVMADIECAKKIDGGIDPNWSEKLTKYIENMESFLNAIKKRIDTNIIVIDTHKICYVYLSIQNKGNAEATRLIVDVKLPEWILAVSSLMDYLPKLPNKPTTPTPTPYIEEVQEQYSLDNSDFSNFLEDEFQGQYLLNDPNFLEDEFQGQYLLNDPNFLETSGRSSITENNLGFQLDSLLHHKLDSSRLIHPCYICAFPGTPTGKYVIKGRVFCKEYDDWEDIELEVEVS